MKSLKLFDEKIKGAVSCAVGVCWVDGELCKNRENFVGCKDCDVSEDFHKKNPTYAEGKKLRKKRSKKEDK